ncbi:MAG: hypothetical protein O3A65_06345 [Proteobacteria bacterium]|nr:hypothetical protein [Pseudomonadota bacterium]
MENSLIATTEDVSKITLGFLASKALFAGLHIEVFTKLAESPKSSAQICNEAKVPFNRINTLMTALTSIGLVDRDNEEKIYSDSSGADAFV